MSSVKQLAVLWKRLRWVVVAGYALGILVLGTLPQNGGLPTVNDKMLHFSVFGGLGGLALFAFIPLNEVSSWPQALNRATWRAMLFSAGVGVLLEVLQAYTPGRYADFRDWVADCGGILPAVLLARAVAAKGSAACQTRH
jgi:peptidoglycan/LPS O-acetylase OafA/YrhL